jgi:hypothetical protein
MLPSAQAVQPTGTLCFGSTSEKYLRSTTVTLARTGSPEVTTSTIVGCVFQRSWTPVSV